MHRDASPRERIGFVYTLAKHIEQAQEAVVLQRCAGMSALEYGCGSRGSNALLLARHGARVVGIDISDGSIRQADAKARDAELPIRFVEMDGERLAFKDGSFDLIVGGAILHHLDLGRACRELHRVLKPHGRAVFIEPLSHNPAIRCFRRLTPHLRSDDEHPLSMRDVQEVRRHFTVSEVRHFILLTLLGLPFTRTRLFGRIDGMLYRLDNLLFRVCPALKRYSWQVLMVLEK